MCKYTCIYISIAIHFSIHSFISNCTYMCFITLIPVTTLIERNHPTPGGFSIYYVPSSRTVCKRTPLEGFVPGSSRGVLLHTVLDEVT